MNKKIISVLVFVSLFFSASFVAAITITNPLASGGINTFSDLLTAILNGVLGIIGGVGVIMLVISGIFFLFSAGDPAKLQRAKAALTYAIIGIAISLAGSLIVLLIERVLGITPGGGGGGGGTWI